MSDAFDRRDFPSASETLIWRNLTAAKLCLVSPPRQEEVRPQDTVSVIGGVAGSSKQGRKAAWKFVKDNWEELHNRYQGGFLISRLIKVPLPQPHTHNLVLSRSIYCSPPSTQIATLLFYLMNKQKSFRFWCVNCHKGIRRAHVFLLHLSSQLTVDGFAIDKMAAEVKVRASQTSCRTSCSFISESHV